MESRKAWQYTALWLGIGWSLFWSLLFVDLPLIRRLELWQSDHLTSLSPPQTLPPEIILVPISATDLKTWQRQQEPIAYAQLVKRLLDADAAVVVLNLLPNWLQTADHDDNPIKALLQKHSDRLVLVLPTTSATQPNPTEWRNYEAFLPLNNASSPPLLGFFEYEPEAKQPQSLSSTARQANLRGTFNLMRPGDRPQTLYSFAWLSLQKHDPQQTRLLPARPIQIPFGDKNTAFPSIPAQSILTNPSPPNLRHKIVVVGFSDIYNPDAFIIQSPWGDRIPALNQQANLIASLLNRSFHRIIPLWLQFSLILGGGIWISLCLVRKTLDLEHRRPYHYWLCRLGGLSGFGLLAILLYGQGWILPLVFPLAVWLATGLSVLISLRFGVQQDLINQQQCELDHLKTVEQTAAIAQSQKILRRIAANIHEGPLQELKLIMDRLELLQLNGKTATLDPILDRLEKLGHHLRQQLNQARAITLSITPELKTGLAAGMQIKLQQMSEDGELTLPIIQNLQPLAEPKLNSQWLEAREDIYCFFIETIHNVIYHAQPPHGNASQVKVSLAQQGDRCRLIIENDGAMIDPAQLEPSLIIPAGDGYGMKLMKTIASELPQGFLECVALETGGMRVKLSWTIERDR